MNIKSLRIHPLTIPFRTSFKHSSAERKVTQSVIVVTETADGTVGVGEGCPREYVTHETVAGAIKFHDRWQNDLMADIGSYQSLERWVDQHASEIDKNPAAWCAIELSLLDALACEKQKTVEALIRTPELIDEFKYTAVLGDATPELFQDHLRQYIETGFTDFKLKITGDVAADSERLHSIAEKTGSSCRVRVDANNLWRESDDVSRYLDEVDIELFGIEEPLRTLDYDGMLAVAGRHGIKVILDESFIRSDQFELVARDPHAFVINLRVSKMGGIIRSLAIAKEAAAMGVPLVVGAQVGETSVLTRAALTVVNAYRNRVIAQEGAYGTLLLERDIATPSLMFGSRGILDPNTAIDGRRFGWQLTYELNDLS